MPLTVSPEVHPALHFPLPPDHRSLPEPGLQAQPFVTPSIVHFTGDSKPVNHSDADEPPTVPPARGEETEAPLPFTGKRCRHAPPGCTPGVTRPDAVQPGGSGETRRETTSETRGETRRETTGETTGETRRETRTGRSITPRVPRFHRARLIPFQPLTQMVCPIPCRQPQFLALPYRPPAATGSRASM
ncbi:hypothetical protein QMK19_36995 [Streptomyces sp. H10-C2]|uniref:hypothetical protein n=1 Tax=unclassified Streptomyces TaxID=2593676 RepID=UPI0024BB9E8E|nr:MULTISPECIES: hypothetical protein [unclassified Streptomyces]MDJ0347091.1 hypothetical protein [Streptomyces sp. PH10-H1]MDJ0375062.1 hypothetical protein [Streptomyces sp. H10-C2]